MVDWFNQLAARLLENVQKPSVHSLTALVKNIVRYNLDCPDSAGSYDLDCPDSTRSYDLDCPDSTRSYNLDCPDSKNIEDLHTIIEGHIQTLVNGYIKMSTNNRV
jgi:hypothetical protein